MGMTTSVQTEKAVHGEGVVARQAVFTGPFTIAYRDKALPPPAADQVLLRINNIGICGSDIQIYHGLHKYMTYPVVPGHEASGEVEAVGAGVTRFHVGQRVIVQPQITCGECYPCRIRRFNCCENLRVKGVHADGFAASHIVVEERFLHSCPDDMPFDLITLAEPLAVGIGAVRRSCHQGANVAVIGAGTIGNLTAQAAQVLGAESVLVTDIMGSKLDYAAKCGIRHCANTREQSLKEAIYGAFGDRGADVIIDCATTPGTFQAALDACRPSSEIVITGSFKVPVELEVPRIQRREVSLIGHFMYVREDFADAIDFLAAGRVNSDSFVTQKFAFDKFDEAFCFIEEHPNDVMKALVMIDQGGQG